MESEKRLIDQMRGADERAFSEIVTRYSAVVERAAVATELKPEEIPDIIQATFMVLWNRRDSPPSASSLGSWLYGVARNLSKKHIRNQSRLRRREQKWENEQKLMKIQSSGQSSSTVDRDTACTLHRNLESLSVQQRQLIIARFWQKKGFGEIGRELGCSEDAAKKRFQTVLNKLRIKLNIGKGAAPLSAAALMSLLEAEGAISPMHSVTGQTILSRPSKTAISLGKKGGSFGFRDSFGLQIAGVGCLVVALYLGISGIVGGSGGDSANGSGRGSDGGNRTVQTEGQERARGGRGVRIPLSSWALGTPEVLSSVDKRTMGRGPFWHYPLETQWVKGSPIVPFVYGMKSENSRLDFYGKDNDGWKLLASLPKISFPKILPMSDGDLGVVGYQGGSATGGYGSTVEFYRFDVEGGFSESIAIAIPDSETRRFALIGFQETSSKRISVSLLKERRGGKPNEIIHRHSLDGGKTWSSVEVVTETSMNEDLVSAMNIKFVGADGGRMFNLFGSDSPPLAA